MQTTNIVKVAICVRLFNPNQSYLSILREEERPIQFIRIFQKVHKE